MEHGNPRETLAEAGCTSDPPSLIAGGLYLCGVVGDWAGGRWWVKSEGRLSALSALEAEAEALRGTATAAHHCWGQGQ